MRRDICYFFTGSNVQDVYKSYLAAATNPVFRRGCSEQPYHTISFGLNFSMKYNMNGGACTLHFIPYQGGTAVDLRFSIAQLAGARYGRYAEDLTNAAASVLGKSFSSVNLPIEMFEDPRNQVTAAAQPAPAEPVVAPPQPAPAEPVVAPPQPAPVEPAAAPSKAAPASGKFCTNCGHTVTADAIFCSQCGNKLPPPERYCTQCGNKVSEDAIFCSQCGNRL